jgi:hypothetical protein
VPQPDSTRQASSSGRAVTPLRGLQRTQTVLGGAGYADVIVAQITGALHRVDLDRALRALVLRHAVLRQRVSVAPGVGPVVQEVAVDAPPLGVSRAPWQREVEFVLNVPFDPAGASWRLRWVDAGTTHHLILAVHHALVDGRTLSVLLAELLAALDGAELGPPIPLAPAALDLAPRWPRLVAPLARRVFAWHTRRAKANTPLPGRRLHTGEPIQTIFAARTLPKAALDALRKEGKKREATVGGALVWATWHATRTLSGDCAVEMMVDVRPLLPGAPDVGMYAAGVLALRGQQAPTAWGQAAIATKQVHRQVKSGLPLLSHAIFEGVDADRWLAAHGVDLAENGGTGSVAQVSNVGQWSSPTTYGDRKLAAVCSATSSIPLGPALMVWLRTVDGQGHLSAIGNAACVTPALLERWLERVAADLTALAEGRA